MNIDDLERLKLAGEAELVRDGAALYDGYGRRLRP